MAAPMKNKNVVSKDSLRRLMKEKTAVAKTATSRIDHPCAKYNALEQLTCVVCKSVVKNERLWNAHIMGRTHKETVAALKHKATNQNVQAPPPAKRKPQDDYDDDIPVKKAKSNGASVTKNSIPDDFFDSNKKSKPTNSSKKTPKSHPKPKSILKNATIRLPNYSGSESESDEELPSTSGTQKTESGLPADFFDAGSSKGPSAPAPTPGDPETKPLDPSMAEKLPEGFFDDPKQDAQVRQVEYKDKMEEEWELFQRAMKEQTTVSEQIQQEDDELKTLERQAEEVDDQMHRWSQVHALAQKKETIMATMDEKMDQDGDDGSSSDMDDLEDFSDWRSKSAFGS